jgi:PAS domain S-box-containing protein
MKRTGISTSYLQAIVNSLADELLVIDRDYRIIAANEAVLKRHGKPEKDVVGKYCYDVSHGLPGVCHPPHHECPINAVWQTGQTARTTHVHVYDLEGERQERYVDIIASPISDRQGNVIAVAELMRDVTEAKQLELKISQVHEQLSALNRVACAVSQSLDLDAVLKSALDVTLEIMKVNTGGILLWDDERQMLCYRVYHGLSNEYAQGVCCHSGEGIAGKVAQTGEAIMVEDISTDPRATHTNLINAEGLRAFISVPLRTKDNILGVLNIASHEARKFSPEHVQLLESIAAQVAVAVENARLHQQVQRQDESRGDLLREIFSIQEEERRRIARELHDETSQTLASLAASLQAIAAVLPPDANEVSVRLRQLQSLSVNILDEIHKLIYELRPTLLDDLGLVAALRWLTENSLMTAGVAVDFKTAGRQKRLAPQLETALFRVVQESIYNIARHAEAKNASLSIQFKKDVIIISVKDDGSGFDVEEAMSSKQRPRGLGLLGMKERVELFNGTFDIRSHPGKGTEIYIEIPTG